MSKLRKFCAICNKQSGFGTNTLCRRCWNRYGDLLFTVTPSGTVVKPEMEDVLKVLVNYTQRFYRQETTARNRCISLDALLDEDYEEM